jgi:hypothetical protein
MYAKRQGAPASKDKNMLKVENPYFDAKSKLPTNTTNLMPQQLQARGKGGDKSVTMPMKGKGKGGLMTRPHSDGFLQDMLTPMGLHNLSDVEKYRKLVAMRNQDIMDKREDQVLREYQHVTQGLRDGDDRVLTAEGRPRADLPEGATDMERQIHAAVKRTTQRGKREIEVGEAQVAGRPFMPGTGQRGQRTARNVTEARGGGQAGGYGDRLGPPFIPRGFRRVG